LSLMDADVAVDLVTVADQISRHGLFDQAGGLDFLAEVANSWRARA
jgi:replicative DNA helicase